jgi:hypothetical protein
LYVVDLYRGICLIRTGSIILHFEVCTFRFHPKEEHLGEGTIVCARRQTDKKSSLSSRDVVPRSDKCIASTKRSRPPRTDRTTRVRQHDAHGGSMPVGDHFIEWIRAGSTPSATRQAPTSTRVLCRNKSDIHPH